MREDCSEGGMMPREEGFMIAVEQLVSLGDA